MLAAMPPAPSNHLNREETPVRDRGDACPGALRLHTADDGALARIRVPAGVLTAGQAYALADAADGEIVADGPTADVVVASPAFAPQVAKILAPQKWLTVSQVAAALNETDPHKTGPHKAGPNETSPNETDPNAPGQNAPGSDEAGL